MLENAVFWGAGCAIVWGFSDYIARLAGRSVGPMAATFAMMMVGGVLITAIMAVMGTPVEWRLDGLHWPGHWRRRDPRRGAVFVCRHTWAGVARRTHGGVLSGRRNADIGRTRRPAQADHMGRYGDHPGRHLAGARTVSARGGDGVAKEYTPAVIRRTIVLSLAAASIYAASLTAADHAIEIYGSLQPVLVIRLMGTVVLMAVLLGRREKVRFPMRVWPVLVAFGILDTLGHLFLFFGLETTRGEYAIVASVA